MALCALCGVSLSGDVALCSHHHVVIASDTGWSDVNRIMCDFFHRKVPPPDVYAMHGEPKHVCDGGCPRWLE